MVNSTNSSIKRLNEKPWYEWIISGTLFMVFVIYIILLELGQWIIIVRMLFDLFGLDYIEYARIVPFVCMYEGENISFIILVASIILAILIVAFLWGTGDVKAVIFLFEIFAIGIALYIKIWVIAIAYVMVSAGLEFGKWTMVGAFIVAVTLHGFFLILRKTVKKTNQ